MTPGWFLIIHLVGGQVITPTIPYPTHDACQVEVAMLNLNSSVKVSYCVWGARVKP